MFPVTREILMYLLGFLVTVMAVLLILILRKRLPLRSLVEWFKAPPGDKKQKPAGTAPPAPVPPPSETGPADVGSIKDRLLEKPAQPPAGSMPEAPKPPPPPAPVPPPAAPPAPEPGTDYMVVDEKREVEKPEPKPLKQKELIARGLMKPEEERGIIARFVPRKAPAKIKALEPEKAGEVPESPPKTAAIAEAAQVDSATISKDPNSFLGQAVSVEGELQLSSKGVDDVWYVLFDKGGSSVVRSKNEIPFKRCRLIAKVERTKLGQLYLDVIRHEKLK